MHSFKSAARLSINEIKRDTTEVKMAKDPVCNMDVDEGKAKHVSEYKGKKYYFCAPGCKAMFDRDPEKFI